MSGVTFDDLRWLHLLWAALLAVALGAYGLWQRRRGLALFASSGLLPRLAPHLSLLRGGLRIGLIAGALLALTAGMIGPRWGQREEHSLRRGLDILVLLDVSKSMTASDIQPNRLERAKDAIRYDLLPALGGDRIGLIAFAGASSVKCPLTHDYGYFRLALQDISVNSAPRGGTAIGDALRKAGECFDGKFDSPQLVLLITDGEDQQTYPLEAAKVLWAERKIPVFALALGDERQGARVPIEAGKDSGFMTHDGNVVWSRADFETLRQVAAVSGLPNTFIPVGTRNFDLGEIYRNAILPAVQAREVEESARIEQPSQTHWFTLMALLAVLLESCLRDTLAPRAARAQRTLSSREAA